MRRVDWIVAIVMFLVAVAFIALCVWPALAQDAVLVSAAPSATTISLGALWAPLAPVLAVMLVGLVTWIVDRILAILRGRTGLKLILDEKHRATLHSAITTGVNIGLEKVGGLVKAASVVDVRSQVLAQAMLWVANAAPDALKHFGLSPEDARQAALSSGTALSSPPAGPRPTPTRDQVLGAAVSGSKVVDTLLGLGLSKLQAALEGTGVPAAPRGPLEVRNGGLR